jgi:hypothetical protein
MTIPSDVLTDSSEFSDVDMDDVEDGRQPFLPHTEPMAPDVIPLETMKIKRARQRSEDESFPPVWPDWHSSKRSRMESYRKERAR